MKKQIILHVEGMHCNACPILIEGELMDLPNIESAKASLKYRHVEIVGEFGESADEEVADHMTELLKKHGYSLSKEKQKNKVTWSDFKFAIPIAGVFIAIFILLQELGLVNLTTSSDVSYSTAFLIGVIASLSSCMAVVGGLVLSVSANYAKEGDKVRPQLLFHLGRMVSFFVLGGVIGALGSTFQLSGTGTFVLSLLVALILIVLGFNLLDIMPWTKKLQPTLPKFIGDHVLGLKKLNHTLTPLLLGVATFFLPCGFTQSMQIYAFETGSAITGAMTMFVFALGTLPVLALLSFSSLVIHTKARSSIFFKSAGLIVIFFGVINLINSLVATGIINPIFNF